MRSKANFVGAWFRMKSLLSNVQVWVGSLYIAPHWPITDVQEQVAQFMQFLPPTTLPCLVSGDANAAINWAVHDDERRVTPVGGDGKGRVLLDGLQGKGFAMIPPVDSQLAQPTSRPRREDVSGRIIDWMAVKHARTTRVQISTDSCRELGVDHDALQTSLLCQGAGRTTRGVRLGKRGCAHQARHRRGDQPGQDGGMGKVVHHASLSETIPGL